MKRNHDARLESTDEGKQEGSRLNARGSSFTDSSVHLKNLLFTIGGGLRRPPSIESAVAAALPLAALPLPQVTWTTLALIQYHQRKRWAWDLAHKRLSRQVQAIHDCKVGRVTGTVPGLPNWTFEFRDPAWKSFLCLKRTGETIFLDLNEGYEVMLEEEFDYWFRERKERGPAEQRLLELLPESDDLFTAVQALHLAGMIRDSDLAFVLNDELLAAAAAAEDFWSRWEDPDERPWIAVQIGDWPFLHRGVQGLCDPELVALTARRARVSRHQWVEVSHNDAGEP